MWLQHALMILNDNVYVAVINLNSPFQQKDDIGNSPKKSEVNYY